MKKRITIIMLMVGFIGFAQIPANYYDSASGLTGYALKTQLKSIITNGHSNQGYGSLYYGYETTDTDNYYESDGTVLDMYSENPTGTDPYNYTHGNNTCGSYSDESDCYNREHLIPQSWFGSSQPMQSDIHHVVPRDGKVNGQRGHYPLAEVGSTSWTSLNGSKRGTCSVAGYSGTVFEPIDEFKGDIARIYFYMATRYQNNIGSWENASANGSDPVLDGSSNQVFENWYLQMLMAWHINDPVSQRELDRNNAAYNYQGNANPFISHPEWVVNIWNQTPDTENPTNPTNLVTSNITSSSVDLTWNASTDNIAVFGYDIYRDTVLIANTTLTNYTDSSLQPTTTYNYYIVAKDAVPNYSGNSNTETITTLVAPTYVFSENFNDCTTVPNNFTAYSEISNKDWNCLTVYGENNTGSMQMNGYQEDVSSKDWLITTNSIDFTLFTNEQLSLYLVHTYGTMSLDLLYSADYDGVSNPVNFTWTALPNVTIDTHNGTSTQVIQTITNADISSINQEVYIAFKYYSNGSPTRWTLDNFNITGESVASIGENKFKKNVLVFPNPSNTNTINVKADLPITAIKIFSIFGQLISEKEVLNSKKVTLTNLATGIYLVKITSDKFTITKKVIIK